MRTGLRKVANVERNLNVSKLFEDGSKSMADIRGEDAVRHMPASSAKLTRPNSRSKAPARGVPESGGLPNPDRRRLSVTEVTLGLRETKSRLGPYGRPVGHEWDLTPDTAYRESYCPLIRVITDRDNFLRTSQKAAGG